ncbi:DUF4124 domain-containing protein [Marinobacterium rhizophilum]|uniref:DUF4124 domain-containing protein n=1 Tax=Marinobacterium rhizophilum TaxID=420402 RepID=UPI0009FFE0F4|nr:DUF4124 domain-containing protein [Marinobacterium rhizophilum]
MFKESMAVAILVAALPVQAGVYKCEAANGRLSFSDKPCPEDRAQLDYRLTTMTRNASVVKKSSGSGKRTGASMPPWQRKMRSNASESCSINPFGYLKNSSAGRKADTSHIRYITAGGTVLFWRSNSTYSER